MTVPPDWATSRVEMLLVGILGDDWRYKLGDRKRIGARVVDTSSELLRVLSGTLREVSQFGPRMHECNHPTDEDLCDKLESLQILMDVTRSAEMKWYWCTRCGSLGEVTNLRSELVGSMRPNARLKTHVEWRRPEAPINERTTLQRKTYEGLLRIFEVESNLAAAKVVRAFLLEVP